MPRFVSALVSGWLLFAAHGVRADDDPPPRGVVVVIGDVDSDAALAAAREAGGASFRSTSVTPNDATPDMAPDAAVADLRGYYLDADFLRCLAQLSDRSLDRTALLASGHPEAAAAVGIFGAGCALGAGDEELAKRLVEEVVSAELPTNAVLEVVSPDVQQLAESTRQQALSQTRKNLEITSRPVGAAVSIDGGMHRCAATPCEVALLPGEHVLTVEALGYARRTLVREVSANTTLALSLDPAPSDVVAIQLSEALAAGVPADDALFVSAAARAFGARVVVTVFEHEGRSKAALYDRQSRRIVAEASVSSSEGPTAAVRSVVSDWRGEVEPTRFYQHPLFWIATIGAAVIAAVVVGLVLAPQEPRYDIVFGN